MKSTKTQKIKYLCVDTNIFVQCCLLEIDGDNLDVLTKLHGLLDKDKIKLLLPEVIKLEFYKILKSKIGSLINKIGIHKKNINTDSFNKKIREDLIKLLDQYAEKKRKRSEKVRKEIESIFSHKNVIQTGLELAPQIFIEAYKMSINGDKPYDKETADNFQQDCLIIESLRSFLKDKRNYEFFFCSQNKDDFASDDPKKKHSIHEDINKKFSHISYYENLGELLNTELNTKVSEEIIRKLDYKKSVNNLNEGELVKGDLSRHVGPEQGVGIDEGPIDSTPGEPK